MPADWRIVVLLDADRDDCRILKKNLEDCACSAGFVTKSRSADGVSFHVVNRIIVEELEAWFFGDVEALTMAYPGIPATLGKKARYRDPDAIAGGTWETLQKLLKQAGYYPQRMPKIEVARKISHHMDPDRNRSRSFQLFRDTVRQFVKDDKTDSQE